MNINQKIAPFAAFILKNIKTHKNRKRFAKFFGPFFDGTVAKTAYGFPMIARWYDNTNRISFEGSYGIVADFIKKIPEDAMFIDIGANQGCTSILASHILRKYKKKGGHILAFEPSGSSFKLMLKNLNLNNCSNVFTFNKAVSKEYSDLFLDDNDSGNSGASRISSEGHRVPAGPININDIKQFDGYKNIYIKIDTEGYEMNILEGIQDLFEAKLIRKLVIEIDSINLKKYGNCPSEVYRFLDKNGFKPTMGLKSGHYDEVFTEK
jgi:FkbM family methyltransferase